jgi:hypothetical protein
VTNPTENQLDRDAAAKALGYRDWADATDHRLTGEQDRQVAALVRAFAEHRLAVLEAGPEWYPIKTAPRDGTELLLWDPRFHRPKIGSWRKDGMRGDLGEMWLDDSYDDWSTGFESLPLQPTLWAKLPPPPTEEK